MSRLKRLAVVIPVLVMSLGLTACNAPENGKIGVVRNGGMLDNSAIRDVQCPGTQARWNGWRSDMHEYPAADQQRTFKFNDDEDADTGPIENLRTKDGLKVTLNGTVFFKTAFDCSTRGRKLVQKFDQANFSRPEGQRPWESFAGWLENQWKPILDSTARDVLLGIEGKDVVSSAALLARDAQVAVPTDVDNKSSVQRIEQALRDGLVTKLREKLGEDYFAEITFNMEQPLLPEVEGAIANAQKAFARVADVRAERLRQQEQVRVEIQKRQVASQKARGYARCPSCARQDELRALPRGITTLVFGGNSPVSIGRR